MDVLITSLEAAAQSETYVTEMQRIKGELFDLKAKARQWVRVHPLPLLRIFDWCLYK